MRRDFFVTGTDTSVGKTLVTAALLRVFREAGVRVAGMKPVAAGSVLGPEGAANEDALLLQSESSARHPYADVNPWLFEPAVAPHIAAAEAGVAIDLARVVSAHARLAATADVVLAEGAGGFLVPLDADRSCAELPGLLIAHAPLREHRHHAPALQPVENDPHRLRIRLADGPEKSISGVREHEALFPPPTGGHVELFWRGNAHRRDSLIQNHPIYRSSL